jgi:hypothetical protein
MLDTTLLSKAKNLKKCHVIFTKTEVETSIVSRLIARLGDCTQLRSLYIATFAFTSASKETTDGDPRWTPQLARRCIGDSLAKLQKLESLTLNLRLPEVCMVAIIPVLFELPALQDLNMNGNEVEEAAAAAIVEALQGRRGGRRLTSLCVRGKDLNVESRFRAMLSDYNKFCDMVGIVDPIFQIEI